MSFVRSGRAAAVVLAAAALAIVAWAGVVLVWGDPFTAAGTARAQRELRVDLEGRMQSARQSRGSLRLRAARYAASLREGDAVGRIVIPRLGLSMVVVEGTSPSDLARGPGHYRITKLPGLGGTIAVAGHRTTHLQPFRHLDDLRSGDSISLVMPYGSFRYVVYDRRIVGSHEWSILRRSAFEKLVLTSCHPLFSASHRIVVVARAALAQAL